jgi:circadian clock protein KaiC
MCLSLAHGVVELEQLSPDYGTSRRRLRVLKMRGVQFREGYHDYSIAERGIAGFPETDCRPSTIRSFTANRFPAGWQNWISCWEVGSTVAQPRLIMGPAGTGKSTLALQYANQMANNGERGMIFAFDETVGIMTARAEGLGLPVKKHIQAGTLAARQVDPAEISPG